MKRNSLLYPFWIASLLGFLCFAAGCGPSGKSGKTLPILGIKQIENGDTLYHTIPDFAFVDQDSQWIDQDFVQGKIYVTDFFFTSCPSICPRMKAQMIRIHETYKDEPGFLLLSHTIDPEYDTPAVLKSYAEKLGVEAGNWHFLTGEKKDIYSIADKYLVSVAEDPDAPGGYIHGGHFILIDTQKRIRGYYDGTHPDEVDELIEDIRRLMDEQEISYLHP